MTAGLDNRAALFGFFLGLTIFFQAGSSVAERANPSTKAVRKGNGKASPTPLRELRRRARDSSERRRASRRNTLKNAPPRRRETPLSPAERAALDKLDQGLGVEFRPPPKGRSVTLNFSEVELEELVRTISVATGRRFMLTGKNRNIKASIFSPYPVSAREAYQALLSVLAANGMTVVPSGRYLKIIDSGDARTAPVRLCLEGEACPADDRYITRIHRLRRTRAADMAQLLGRFKTAQGDVTAYDPTNILIISDFARNVRRMVRLISALDLRSQDTHIWIEPVFHAEASALVPILTKVFEPEDVSSTPAKTSSRSRRRRARRRRRRRRRAKQRRNRQAKVVGEADEGERLEKMIADERGNQLIIVATKGKYLEIMPVLRRLDVPDGGEARAVHVHRLENAKAEELASTLSTITGQNQSRRRSRRRRSRRRRRAPQKSAAIAQLFDGDVRITADESTNSLLFVGSTRDYQSIRPIIENLDSERLQLFLEMMVLEVSVESQRRFGVAFHGGAPVEVDREGVAEQGFGVLGTSFDSGQLNSLILDPSTLQGLALGLRGPELEGSEESELLPAGLSIPAFGVVIQALQTSSDVNVLSTPHLLAMDNEEAEIQVGQNVPVSTSFASGAGALTSLLNQSGGSGSASRAAGGLFPQMSVGRQNVGIKVAVTPQINQSSRVRLEVQVEVSEVSGESDLGPIIGQRTAKTICTCNDQQTVVLGGLVTDRVINGVQKVPFLADIPFLGRLFKRTTKRTTKRNLLIFMTPHIVRDATDFRRIFTRKMRERREFVDRYTALDQQDYQPHLDYARTNGLLEEINLAVDSVDEERERRELLEGAVTAPPEHAPQAPLTADHPLETKSGHHAVQQP